MSQGQWSDDRQWWWNGREWIPANQAPPEAQRPAQPPPSPRANDNFGWIVNVSNLRYDIASGNEFEKPEAGNVFVAVDVSFTNKLKTEQHANPTEFVLQDGAGIKHQISFMTTTCPIWEA